MALNGPAVAQPYGPAYGYSRGIQPLDRLLPRAWEIAEKIMQKPRAIRRLTSAVLRRQWKRRLVQDLGFHVAHELLGIQLKEVSR